MHLGDFGAALKELDPGQEKDSFSFFGEKFEIVGVLPPMLMLQIGAFMTGKVDESEGMGAMWEAMTVSLDQPDLDEWTGQGPDDRPAPVKQFNRFYRLAVNRKADERSLMELVMSIFQASGGERPTVQVPVSPAGLSPTSPSSSTLSSTPQDSGAEVVLVHDASVPHLRPVSQVLAG